MLSSTTSAGVHAGQTATENEAPSATALQVLAVCRARKGICGIVSEIVKNKVAPPFTEAEFDIMYNEGISSTGSLLDLALEKGVLEKRGSWLSYKGTQLAQGRDAAKEVLRSDAGLFEQIDQEVRSALDSSKKP